MKYGYFDFHRIAVEVHGADNLGDILQQVAINRIYDLMGISEQCRISISLDDLSRYKGEYVLLPVNSAMPSYYIDYFKSKYILPVFLSVSFMDNWTSRQIEWLRQFEPIGCRDENTLSKLRANNISSYLNGCLAITFERRTRAPGAGGGAYFIDVPSPLRNYIPAPLKKNVCFTSHAYIDPPPEAYFGGKLDTLRWVRNRLEEYKTNASLIVTSRMHAAVSALALGIPVVAAASYFHPKFSWLDRFIPLYDRQKFDKIDWNPKAVNVEDVKEKVMAIAVARIKDAALKWQRIVDASWYYENYDRSLSCYKGLSYPEEAMEYIRTHWDKEESIEYSFWGIATTAVELHEFIKINYPLAILKNVYNLTAVTFEGIVSRQPDEIAQDKTFLFVTSDNASSKAAGYFEELGRSPKDYFLCKHTFLTPGDLEAV